jgi:large subunit ribosomal protein L17
MRHRNAGKRLGRRKEERLALARNLTASLFGRFGQEREFITTTIVKAKWVKPFAEKAITLGIKGYRELQKAADVGGTTVAEMRKQHTEGATKDRKRFKDFPPKAREHIAKSIHFRRMAAAQLRDADAVRALFDQIAPRYLERPGGYLRVLRKGEFSLGDNAPLAIIGFIEGPKVEQPAAAPQA